MSHPIETRCLICGTRAAETVCHLCKTPRREYAMAILRENDYANAAISAGKVARAEGRIGLEPTLSEMRRVRA